jgi:hypothetical protein
MLPDNASAELEQAAKQMAAECRAVVQGCLREKSGAIFASIILAGLKSLHSGGGKVAAA